MYGFPLTLYVLTGTLGIEVPWVHVSGHLWASLLGYGLPGAMLEMALGYGLVFLGISLLARGWYEVHRASRAGRLATTGLYGAVRHPQYTGILLAIFGQLVHWPTIPTLLLAPLIGWAYIRLARREEARLSERFGETYRAYRRVVPAFLPRATGWRRFLNVG
jgi:protein-S-isoprenylcysteine O-methyltransferase Ste14